MLFADWLETQNLTRRQAAKLFGTTSVCIYYWASGKHRPSPDHTRIIEFVSEGQVTAGDLQRAYELARENKNVVA
jgi:DNA-binding transcriptional regulator YdaS (Cro superfamily)